MRDATADGQPNQTFYWNLWCLSKDPEITGTVVHFPGQFDVDLDVHFLAPAAPEFEKDHWDWKQQIFVWKDFCEEQYGIRVMKQGSTEDFFTVLYPRAAGQGPAQVTALASNAAVQVAHMEGTDVVLLSPGKAASITNGDVRLAGEIAFARRYTNGDVRLAVVKGTNAVAALGPWELRSSGPVAMEVEGTAVSGESSGEAHTAQITLPPAYGAAVVTLDGKGMRATRDHDLLTIEIPAGHHIFTVQEK
jgi:hypothetical protein